MPKKNVYVEPHPDGFAVTRANADRASRVYDTQAEVKPDVARVRHTKNGNPDQFRKG
jgi:hypothetical protein